MFEMVGSAGARLNSAGLIFKLVVSIVVVALLFRFVWRLAKERAGGSESDPRSR